MTAHPAIAAVPKTGTPNRALLQALLVSRFAYIFRDDEDPEAFDPRGEDDTPTVWVLGYRGQFFWYDESDATTDHDGTTCIVTVNGERYKIFGVDLLITHVLSKTETDPPDPDDVDEEARPVNGDAYIVPAASSGDWADKEKYIAVWIDARKEWFFIAPKAGWTVWIPGDTADQAWHYDSVQDDWVSGLGEGLADANTVPLSAILGCAGSLTIRVENQTTTSPPGSPSLEDAYIIGAGATGDWTGHDGKVAICEDGATFTLYTPQDGDEIYDKNTKTRLRWVASSSVWQAATTGYASVEFFEDLSAATLSSTGSNKTQSGADFPSSPLTQTADKSKILETLTGTVTADRSGQAIEIEYDADINDSPSVTTTNNTYYRVLASLFIDNETNARATKTIVAVKQDSGPVVGGVSWRMRSSFNTALSDTTSHTVKIVFHFLASGGTTTAFSIPVVNRRITVRKLN
jgi:hypothetical protein